MEFPRLVYRSAANHKLVENAAEYNQALASGWFGSVPEAQGQKVPAAPAPKAPEDLAQPVAPVLEPVASGAKKAKKAATPAPVVSVAPDASQATKNPWD